MNHLELHQLFRGWAAALLAFAASTCDASVYGDAACAGGCSGHGVCMNGGCLCAAPWAGRDCGFLLQMPLREAVSVAPSGVALFNSCAGGCSGRGVCHDGACYCDPGFFGPSCADASCPNACYGHGTCASGLCSCHAGWAGQQCEVQLGPGSLGEAGGVVPASTRAAGRPGLALAQSSGQAYAAKTTVPAIDPAILANVRAAVALAQTAAEKAEVLSLEVARRVKIQKEHKEKEAAAKDAAERIRRAVQRAHARSAELPGHEFDDAHRRKEVVHLPKESVSLVERGAQAANGSADASCSSTCSGHGSCSATHDSCTCDSGWQGDFCDTRNCPNDCSDHGLCVDSRCLCDSGFFGDGCHLKRCPEDCGGNGYCFQGRCQCTGDWGGVTCMDKAHNSNVVSFKLPKKEPIIKGLAVAGLSSVRALPGPGCPGNCSNHGMCHLGRTCKCYEDFFGTDCADYCPHSCSGHGECIHGSCLCLAGFAGPACNMEQCCSGHGSCKSGDGTCTCDPSWTGPNCEVELVCADPLCSSHGVCNSGKCYCAAGYSGPTCANNRPPCDLLCGDHGTCNTATSICECDQGWTGRNCSLPAENMRCPKDCSGHGACIAPYCSCWPTWGGESCDLPDPNLTQVLPPGPCDPSVGNMTLLALLGCSAGSAQVADGARAGANVAASANASSSQAALHDARHDAAAPASAGAPAAAAAVGTEAPAAAPSRPSPNPRVSLAWLRPAPTLSQAVGIGGSGRVESPQQSKPMLAAVQLKSEVPAEVTAVQRQAASFRGAASKEDAVAGGQEAPTWQDAAAASGAGTAPRSLLEALAVAFAPKEQEAGSRNSETNEGDEGVLASALAAAAVSGGPPAAAQPRRSSLLQALASVAGGGDDQASGHKDHQL